jgi:hypothetical protein
MAICSACLGSAQKLAGFSVGEASASAHAAQGPVSTEGATFRSR